MDLVPPNLVLIQDLVRDAEADPIAEAKLRKLIRGAADNAPPADVARIGQAIVEVYRGYIVRDATAN